MSPTKKNEGFSAEEKAAMRARARELKAAAEGETAVLDALAKMTPGDRALGKRIHALVTEAAPGHARARGPKPSRRQTRRD